MREIYTAIVLTYQKVCAVEKISIFQMAHPYQYISR